jgi:hypothetical protein
MPETVNPGDHRSGVLRERDPLPVQVAVVLLEKWIAAYKAGRTFVGNGPMLLLDVHGREPGDAIQLTGARSVTVRARAQSMVPMSVLK